MKRIIMVLAVAALMAVMMVAMAAPAFAHPNNPYSTGPSSDGSAHGANNVVTYKAPPADGGTPPGRTADGAAGGNTSYTEGICRGPGC